MSPYSLLICESSQQEYLKETTPPCKEEERAVDSVIPKISLSLSHQFFLSFIWVVMSLSYAKFVPIAVI